MMVGEYKLQFSDAFDQIIACAAGGDTGAESIFGDDPAAPVVSEATSDVHVWAFDPTR
jgi:hypothetical protein